MTTATPEYMRKWRQTPAGQQNVKARGLAQAAAIKWVIANRPDVWADILADSRVRVGLPIELTPAGTFTKPIDHGSRFGAETHRRRGEQPCAECRAANNEYERERQREWRRRRREVE